MHDDNAEFTLKEKIEKELPPSLEIDVEIDQGKAVLTGVVDCLAEKMQAESIVKRFPDVSSVRNLLTVSADGNTSDRDLKEAIEEELLAFGNKLSRLSVQVSSGRVFLRGTAEDMSAGEEAAKLIARIPGVAVVDKKLEILH